MRISVLGSGSWGTALSRLLANNGHDVTLWSAVAEEIDSIATTRRHPILNNLVVPDQVSLTKSIEEACTGFDMIVCAVPSPYVRGTFEAAAPFIEENQLVVSVTKGIESSTLMTMTDIIADVVRKPLRMAALSGPTHAEEVAVDLPTAILAASKDIIVANTVQQVFDSKTFRVFTSPDMRGVELCGALKNIIALAAGISEGLGYGDNAKAALITRGLVEISCLGHAMGCQEQTFYGLAGIGDMIVTATSRHSRNNRAGNLLGRGFSAATAKKEVGMVVEGLNVLPAAMRMKEIYGVELPVITGVNDIVNGRSPRLAAQRMMTGSTTAEMVKSV